MQSPNGESELLGPGGHGNASLGLGLGHAHHQTDGLKINSKSKERKNYLQIYARQFGLNDRGCYVAVAFAALAFLLFVIVIAMGATWPGKPNMYFLLSYKIDRYVFQISAISIVRYIIKIDLSRSL